MSTQSRYSDFDINFSKNSFTGDVAIRREANSVKQSIMNLLLTRKGERPFNPSYGVGIGDILFENFGDVIILPKLNRDIEEHIDAFEPRATFDFLELDDGLIDSNTVSLTVHYFILNYRRQPEQEDSLTIGIKKVR